MRLRHMEVTCALENRLAEPFGAAWVSAGFEVWPGLLPGLINIARGARSPSSHPRGGGELGAGHCPQAASAIGEAAC